MCCWDWRTMFQVWGAAVRDCSERNRTPWGICKKWDADWALCIRKSFPGWGMEKEDHWILQSTLLILLPMVVSWWLHTNKKDGCHWREKKQARNRGTRRSEEGIFSLEFWTFENIGRLEIPLRNDVVGYRDSLFGVKWRCWKITLNPQTPKEISGWLERESRRRKGFFLLSWWCW